MKNLGKIVQVQGPIVDIRFSNHMPELLTAIEIPLESKNKLIVEVAQHIGLKQ